MSGKNLGVVEFVGGLGDILLAMYEFDNYVCLEALEENDCMTVMVNSPNPHAKELFLWHRNASRINLRDIPFEGLWFPEHRRRYKLDDPKTILPRGKEPVIFYPSPEDHGLLAESMAGAPYVVFSVSAGINERTIPVEIAESALETCLGAGFRVILVGRTYSARYLGQSGDLIYVPRNEVILSPRPGVIDTINKLTVPAVATLVSRAAAVFCCHSAVCLMSWYVNRPTYLLCPKDYYGKRMNAEDRRFWFGCDNRPGSWHGEYASHNPAVFTQFLESVRLGQSSVAR